VNLDRSKLSVSLKILSDLNRASLLKMTSVGVLMRDRVRVNMLGEGA
jgi:hypothetical protein